MSARETQVLYEDASICSSCVNTEEPEEREACEEEEGELWDLTRPLEGNCKLWLLKFEDKGGKAVEGGGCVGRRRSGTAVRTSWARRWRTCTAWTCASAPR